MRRKHEVLKSHFQVSMMNTLSDSSWEEKAFAEDAAAAGSLGGCIWPPRSYSCSFCRREFRSAQALGGHMNVHRRDRARLKQTLISSPNTDDILDVHNSTSPASNIVNVASTFSASSSTRVSALDHQENFSACNSIVQEVQKGQVFGSDSTTAKRGLNDIVVSTDSKPEEAEKSTKLNVEDSISMCLGSDDIIDHVETNLSVGLNPVFFQNRTTCGEEVIINCKRPKINAVSALPFLVSKDHHHQKYSPTFQWQQVLGLMPTSSREDLDLELRLGILPKVIN